MYVNVIVYVGPCRDSILMLAERKSPETFASSSASKIHDTCAVPRVYAKRFHGMAHSNRRREENGRKNRGIPMIPGRNTKCTVANDKDGTSSFDIACRDIGSISEISRQVRRNR